MLEIIVLVVVLAGFRETAKRRGTKGWPFIVVGAVGWLVAGNLGALLAGQGPHLFFSWGWVGLTYLSIFVLGGGGRRMKEAWQCSECRTFNPPTTLVCLCGHQPVESPGG